MPRSPQDAQYLDREADAFYERNLQASDPLSLRPAKRRIAQWIDEAGVRPRCVLEYGCSHGDLLHHYVRERGVVEARGIEPSGRAVERGRAAYGDAVRLDRGTLAENPLCGDPESRGHFDLIVIEDVLCWVGRDSLFRSIANVDEALAEGGFLFLREFLPRQSTRNRNHHVEDAEVYCYKPSGPHFRMFTASGAYAVVAQRVWMDREDRWVEDAGRDPFESRWCDSLLRKSGADYFEEPNR